MMSAKHQHPRPSRLAFLYRQCIRCRGQTLVEYALILVVISIVAISVLMSMGVKVTSLYSTINSRIESSQQGPGH